MIFLDESLLEGEDKIKMDNFNFKKAAAGASSLFNRAKQVRKLNERRTCCCCFFKACIAFFLFLKKLSLRKKSLAMLKKQRTIRIQNR